MEDINLFLKKFEDLLIDLATYNENDYSKDYILFRKHLLSIEKFKENIPMFILKNRKSDMFRQYMQNIGGYKERRSLIYEEFDNLYDIISIKNEDNKVYSKDEIELFLDKFEDLLIEIATYNEDMINNYEKYEIYRIKFLSCPYYSSENYVFLKRRPEHFRLFLQDIGGYKERKAFISDEFNKIFDVLEYDNENKNKEFNNIESSSDKTYDVFVSHSSKDKMDFVNELVELLKFKGLTVWYDNDFIKVGHNLRKRINDAINNSNFAIVVFSKDFIKSQWTNYEYDNIFLNFYDDEKILPILHEINKDDLKSFDNSISMIKFLSTNEHSTEEIVEEIFNRISEY